MASKSTIKEVEKVEVPEESGAPLTIAQPSGGFDLNKFKSKRTAAIANIETLPTSLPVHGMKDANDFVRLHPNEEAYWSDELCFLSVPVKGQKHNTLHLIDEDLALQYLESKEICASASRLPPSPATFSSSARSPRRTS